jgi:RNA polymerase sigma-70 factor (ECF subfamily)
MAVVELEPVGAWPAIADPSELAADDLAAEDRVDADLVRRARAGDRTAFERLYERHHEAIVRLCSFRLRSRDDAADAAQETFLRAWRALATIDDGRRFYPWLSVIARNVCTDITRKPNRTSSFDDCWDALPPQPGGDADAGLLAEVDAAAVITALDRLTDRHREILQLREYEEWSYERIATDQQLDLNAVKSLVWRARQALRREYLSLTAEDARFAGLLGPVFALRRFLARTGARLTDVGGAVGQAVGTGTTATTAVAVSAAGAVGAVTVVAVASVGGGAVAPPVPVQAARPPAAVAAPQVARQTPAVVTPVAAVDKAPAAAAAPVPVTAGTTAGDDPAPSASQPAVWPSADPAPQPIAPTPSPGTTVPAVGRSDERPPRAAVPGASAGVVAEEPGKAKGGAPGRKAVAEPTAPAAEADVDAKTERTDAKAERTDAKADRAEARAEKAEVKAESSGAIATAAGEPGGDVGAAKGNGANGSDHGNGNGNGNGNGRGKDKDR